MVAIFPKLCFWQRSLCSNLGGIDPEKLYRATLIQRSDVARLLQDFNSFSFPRDRTEEMVL